MPLCRFGSTLLLVCLALPRASAGLTLGQYLERLSSPAEGVRFDAAVNLLALQRVDLPALLTDGAQQAQFRQAFQDSPEARAALDFVLAKRGGAQPSRAPVAVKGPNVLVISIDTLRADHLGCYGYKLATTPTLDTLAAQGAVFLNAVSTSSWTLPSHMSLFTSLYPSVHKLEKGGKLGSVRLDDAERTLAQTLNASGYTTAGFVAHPFLSREWGFDRGFDLYRRYGTHAEAQVSRALLWLDWYAFHLQRGAQQPRFFLFLHFLDPHEPYAAPSQYVEKFFPKYQGPLKPEDKLVTMFTGKDFATPEDFRYALALYDAEINFVDAQLARLFRRLAELGWSENTLVVVTSDHGEEFKDHGSMGHKETLYEEQLRVPLIMSYPRVIRSGQRITTPVSLIDVFPTILDLIGLPPYPQSQGVNLAAYLRPATAATASAPRTLFAELGPLGNEWERRFHRKVARTERFKLVVNYGENGTGKQLYELSADPHERQDVYASKREDVDVRQLEESLEAFIRSGIGYKPGAAERNRIEIDADTRERLRALGYID